MKLFLDTNVILDLIIKRKPFFEDTAKIVSLYEDQKFVLVTSSVSFVNCNYILGKNIKKEKVLDNLKILRSFCSILEVSQSEIDISLNSNFNDFEDAVQHYTALKHNCDYIITRDSKDFKNSEIPVMTPVEFLASLNKN